MVTSGWQDWGRDGLVVITPDWSSLAHCLPTTRCNNREKQPSSSHSVIVIWTQRLVSIMGSDNSKVKQVIYPAFASCHERRGRTVLVVVRWRWLSVSLTASTLPTGLSQLTGLHSRLHQRLRSTQPPPPPPPQTQPFPPPSSPRQLILLLLHLLLLLIAFDYSPRQW